MPISPIPLRNQFLEKDGRVSWPWLKWLLELQGVTPFDPNGIFALTIEETPATDLAQQAATEAILAAQPDPPSVDPQQIEDIAGSVSMLMTEPSRGKEFYAPLGMVVDGNGAVPSTGSKGYVRVFYPCQIVGWTLMADQAGDCQFDVKACAFSDFPTTTSIVASAPPLLSSAQSDENNTLTGWTTTIAKGTVLEFTLDSVATLNRVILELQVERT